MKRFLSFFAVFMALAISLTLTASAAVDVTGVTLDTASVETIAAVMLGALAVIWVARKVVGFLASR